MPQESEFKSAQEHLVVLAKELASPRTEIALKTFHEITRAAGWGTPIPVNRGPEPTKKLHYEDNFELVSMRHREFRRVPNPNPRTLHQYKRIAEQACYRFVNMNQQLCRRNCLLVEDLMSYAQVWTCNYLGLYQVAVETANDNVRKLRAHLKQRFAEFAGMVRKKERNCFPSPDTVQIALLGKSVDENHRVEGFSTDPTIEDGVDVNYVKRHRELDTSDANTRRVSAATILTRLLQNLPHEKMVQTLDEASKNPSIAPNARAEAAKQLRSHQKICRICRPAITEKPGDPILSQPTTSNFDDISMARAAFLSTVPSVLSCVTCKNIFATQVRLMNKKMVLAGAKPVFRTQSNCSVCRRSKRSD